MDTLKDALKDTRFRITLGIAVAFLCISVIASIALSSLSSGSDGVRSEDSENTTEQGEQIRPEPESIEYPDVSFDSYIIEATAPNTSNPVRSYIFQTGFSQTDAEVLATRLGLEIKEIDELNDFVVIRDPDGGRVMNYDTRNGTFYYFANQGDVVKTAETEPLKVAEAYLIQTGLQDGFIGCTHWHQLKETEGTVFAECHRLWDAGKIGYPILNVYGAMNLPADYRLEDLELGSVLDGSAPDPEVLATSDNKPGLKRPNQFNTYTIALEGNRVIAITSTMRPLLRVDKEDQANIKTPEEALTELQGEKKTLTFVWPAGEGIIDMDKVYQNKSVHADSVVVTDAILAYLEEPLDIPQAELVLAYVYKGKAELDNGLAVEFLDLVPAHKGSDSVLGASTLLAQAVCGDAQTIQFCTFSFFGREVPPTNTPAPINTPVPTKTIQKIITNTPTPTQPPQLTNTPTPTPTPPPDEKCPPYDREIILPNGTTVGYFSPSTTPYNNINVFHYVPEPGNYIRSRDDIPENYAGCRLIWDQYGRLNDPAKQLLETQKCVAKTILEFEEGIEYGKNIRAMCNPDDASPCAVTRTASESPDECYVVTLGSPNLHVYPGNNNLSIGLGETAQLTYSYPAADTSQSWRVSHDETIYYEYEKSDMLKHIARTGVQEGYYIHISELASLVKNISEQLGLTAQETDVFVKEALRETFNLPETNIYVHVLNQELINDVLPLTIDSTNVHINRIYLYVVPAISSKEIVAPVFTSITRSAPYIVETGVITD